MNPTSTPTRVCLHVRQIRVRQIRIRQVPVRLSFRQVRVHVRKVQLALVIVYVRVQSARVIQMSCSSWPKKCSDQAGSCRMEANLDPVYN